jgi:hypothetical protein
MSQPIRLTKTRHYTFTCSFSRMTFFPRSCFGVLEDDSTAYIFQLTDRLTEELPGALSLK